MKDVTSTTPPVIPGLVYVARIASGGYSEVHLYEQQMPRMKVAVKVLTNVVLTDKVREAFTAEANTTAQLGHHPYIVQVSRADIASDGRPYLVLEYYPQPNLGARARTERFSVPDVLRLGIQIAGAVETAHRAGILHRDIKPANILTSEFGTPGLTDFGIAGTKADAGGQDPDGMSIPWSPPEILFGTGKADERSDVYSLAATLWHLLVGRSPFEVPGGVNDSLSLMRRIAEGDLRPTGRQDVPPSLEHGLRQAMSRDRDVRPPSALAFARSLQAVEQEERLPLTTIVVPDDSDGGARAMDSGDPDDATRIRRPVHVQAQEAAGPRKPTAPAASGRPAPAREPAWSDPELESTRSRPRAAEESYEDATVRRAVAIAEVDDAEPSRPSSRRSLRPFVIGAAVLGVVAVAVVVATAWRSGGTSAQPAAVQQATHAVDPGQDAVVTPPGTPPGTPQVAWKQLTPTAVQFSWVYSNPLPTDTFQWQVVGAAGAATVTSKPITETPVPVSAGHPVCIQVRVIRVDGAVSPVSTPTCATG